MIEKYPCKDCLILIVCERLCLPVLEEATYNKEFMPLENINICGYCGNKMVKDLTGEYDRKCTMCRHKILL